MRNYKEYSVRKRKENNNSKKNSNSIMFSKIMLRITNLWAYVNFAERHWKNIYISFYSFHFILVSFVDVEKKTILEVFIFTCAFGLLLNDLQNRFFYIGIKNELCVIIWFYFIEIFLVAESLRFLSHIYVYTYSVY